MLNIQGIHHITGICGGAQENLDFYTGFLGLRLVKKTVNFDDPGSYHLYYGDEEGSPGTILTFFPWEHSVQGRAGVGTVSLTAFSVPTDAGDDWINHFADTGVDFDGPFERFGERGFGFQAPDQLQLEIIGDDTIDSGPARWDAGVVDPHHAIRGFHSAGLSVRDFDFLQKLFVDYLDYSVAGEDGDRIRLTAAGTPLGHRIDLIRDPDRAQPRSGKGTIHHIAFRARDEAHQLECRERMLSLGLNVTDVLDRSYFKSIYFREPGGILFEIATDSPGFAVDEEVDMLGSGLKLPPWLESRRPSIEARLVELH
jgi:glyoxalase family protein